MANKLRVQVQVMGSAGWKFYDHYIVLSVGVDKIQLENGFRGRLEISATTGESCHSPAEFRITPEELKKVKHAV